MGVPRSVLLGLWAVAASAAHAAEPTPAPPPPLPSSSVAAVLAQRGALDLTPEQVKQLEQIQARLERSRDEAKEALARPPDAQGSRPGSGSAGSGAPPRGGAAPPQGGGLMSGGKTRPSPSIAASKESPAQLLSQRLDELDTEAFLQAAELLPESKRERAIEIASRYRERLYEQREREGGR